MFGLMLIINSGKWKIMMISVSCNSTEGFGKPDVSVDTLKM
jgi:hypothetical protein